MKIFWNILLLVLLVAPQMGRAEVFDTLNFEIADLQIDAGERTIHVVGLETIQDAGRPSIPVYAKFFHTTTNFDARNVSCQVLSADTIELEFSPMDNLPDVATGDMAAPTLPPPVIDQATWPYPGGSYRITSCRMDGQVVLTALIFPIQFLDPEHIIFNRRIAIAAEMQNARTELEAGIPNLSTDDSYFLKAEKIQSNPSVSGCPLGNQYVIVTSPVLAGAFDSLCDLKLATGFDAAVAVTDSIYAYYGGIDNAEAVRNYLKDFYAAGGRYVLLGGDEHTVPVRYAYFYDTSIPPTQDQLMICDRYFADCDGDWDKDGDGVWGEPNDDNPDMGAELTVGRLPFSQPGQVLAYTAKLRQYLFDPGAGSRDYLTRSIFITSDQMRDYFDGRGQQQQVAQSFPSQISTDPERLAEAPTGVNPAPTGPSVSDAITALCDGYGFVNILAHGRADGFILNSSEYNLFPKTYLLTAGESSGSEGIEDLVPNHKTSLYYSIACSQGAIDLESLYGMTAPSVVEGLLSLDSAGAIGIVAFSRWGWVGSSYKLMASFYQHLFSDASGYPVEAMYRSHLDYPYYRDQIYGQNFFGDPSLRLYLDEPSVITVDAPSSYDASQPLICRLELDGAPLAGHPAVVEIGDTYEAYVSDASGQISIPAPNKAAGVLHITAFAPGVVSGAVDIYPDIAADADDNDQPLPNDFELCQNYPNPFNPATTIRFTLARAGHVALQIFDVLGRLVDKPVDGVLIAGDHSIVWSGVDADGRELPTGIYIYRLISSEGSATRKMILVR